MIGDGSSPTIPGLEVLTRLSAGGMGEVFLAEKTGAHGFRKRVAVKLIRAELTTRPDVRAMFLDEARLLAQLQHPAIAPVFDFGEVQGQLYLVMEYVAGLSLAQLNAAPQGPLPPRVAALLMAQVLDGLHAAHQAVDRRGHPLGVVHRDVSPQNVILSFEGQPKILDFGIALFRERLAPVTELDAIKGKVPYLAPEQLLRGAVDRRADVYAAGAVLYELITGQVMFGGDDLLSVATAIATLDPGFDGVFRTEPELADLTAKAVAKDPERRFPTARAFAEALEDWARPRPGEDLRGFTERVLAPIQREHQRWIEGLIPGTQGANFGPATARPGRRATELDLPNPAAASADPAPGLTSPPVAVKPTAVVPKEPAPPPVAAPRSPSAAPRIEQRWRTAAWPLVLLVGALGVAVGSAVLLPHHVGTTTSPPRSALGSTDGGTPTTIPTPPPAAPPPLAAEVVSPTTPAPPPPGPIPAATPSPRRGARANVAAPPPPPPVAPADLTPATLSIGAVPYGLVRLDGQELGVTPIVDLSVAPGRHVVELLDASDGSIRRAETLELRAGERRPLHW